MDYKKQIKMLKEIVKEKEEDKIKSISDNEDEWRKHENKYKEDIKGYQAEEISCIEIESFKKESSIKKELSFYIERVQEKEKEILKDYKELQDYTLE